jgi:hypothetical protein
VQRRSRFAAISDTIETNANDEGSGTNEIM